MRVLDQKHQCDCTFWRWADQVGNEQAPEERQAGLSHQLEAVHSYPRLADRSLIPQGAGFQELVLRFCFSLGNKLQRMHLLTLTNEANGSSAVDHLSIMG